MEDLLQSQIQESCKLALPDGLNDLCYDISREVLRAQPKDLLGFITNYLSCLLVTRENLKVAAKILEATGCKCSSQGTTLPDDLRDIGIDEEDIEVLLEVVDKWFGREDGGTVRETALLSELLNRTSLTQDQLPEVVEAIRNAYLRMQNVNKIIFESSSDEDINEVDRAAKHTLHLYRRTEPNETQYHQAATRIQAAYRAYGVRRERERKQESWSYAPKIEDRADYIAREIEEEEEEEEDEEYESVEYDGEEFKDGDVSNVLSRCSGTTQATSEIEQLYRENHAIPTVSSVSLAGSMIKLPKHKPYTVQEPVKEIVEEEVVRIEKESSVFDYTKLRDEYYEADDELNFEDTPKPDHSQISVSDHSLLDNTARSVSSIDDEEDDDDSVDDFVETVDEVIDKVDSKSEFEEVDEDPNMLVEED